MSCISPTFCVHDGKRDNGVKRGKCKGRGKQGGRQPRSACGTQTPPTPLISTQKPPQPPVGTSGPLTTFPNVWTAMGRHIVTGPSTPRQTGPQLRTPGPPHAPKSSSTTHFHPEAATATRWHFLTPHDIPIRVCCHGAHYCSRSTHTPPNGTTTASAATALPYEPPFDNGIFVRRKWSKEGEQKGLAEKPKARAPLVGDQETPR